jgi:hypothetical protein
MFFWCSGCEQHVDEDLDGCVEMEKAWYCLECYKEIVLGETAS